MTPRAMAYRFKRAPGLEIKGAPGAWAYTNYGRTIPAGRAFSLLFEHYPDRLVARFFE